MASFARIGMAISLALLACRAGRADDAPPPTALVVAGCENVYAVTDNLLSGGAPEGDSAFQALAALGVKTIISVDGARPDVQGAAKYGLRYVHLPFGYDGVPRDRALEISHAIRDLPGKIYIHCHHGKHRSPAALAGALVCSQGWSADRATGYMRLAGTSPSYAGLYSTVRKMTPAPPEEIAKADASYPAVANVPSFVETMVRAEELLDLLTQSKKERWQVPKDSPDVVPANVALQIMELFREGRRTGQSKRTEPDFNAWLAKAELNAAGLETALREGPSEKAEIAYNGLANSCKNCHEKYRNTLKIK